MVLINNDQLGSCDGITFITGPVCYSYSENEGIVFSRAFFEKRLMAQLKNNFALGFIGKTGKIVSQCISFVI
jgi:hypothetical protein